jgi:hypothetical protein
VQRARAQVDTELSAVYRGEHVTEGPSTGVTILPAGADAPPPPPPTSAKRGWLAPVATAVVVVLIAGAAVVFGKGSLFGGQASAGALDLVHASATKTSAAGTSKFELSMSMQHGGQTQTATGSGAFDYANQAGTLTVDVPGEGAMTVRFLDDVIYMQLPMSAMNLFGGADGSKRWFKLDLSQLPSGLRGALPNQMYGNPSQLLQALLSTTSAKELGSDTVRGVPTTHYATDVSLAQLVKAWSGGSLPDHGLAAGTAHIEVWLDKAGLTRRLRTTFSVAALGTATMNIDYFDFGAPVQVTAPPSNEVFDVGQMLGSLKPA